MRVNLGMLKNGIVNIKKQDIYIGMSKSEYDEIIGSKETKYSNTVPRVSEDINNEEYEFNAKVEVETINTGSDASISKIKITTPLSEKEFPWFAKWTIRDFVKSKELKWYGDSYFYTLDESGLISFKHETDDKYNLMVITIMDKNNCEIPTRKIETITTEIENKYGLLRSNEFVVFDDLTLKELKEDPCYPCDYAFEDRFVLHLIPLQAKELLPDGVEYTGPEPLTKKDVSENYKNTDEIERIYFVLSEVDEIFKTTHPVGIISALYITVADNVPSEESYRNKDYITEDNYSSFAKDISYLKRFAAEENLSFSKDKGFISQNIVMYDYCYNAISAMPPREDYLQRILNDINSYPLYDSAEIRIHERIARLIMKYKDINSITELNISYKADTDNYNTHVKFLDSNAEESFINFNTWHTRYDSFNSLSEITDSRSFVDA